MTKLQLPPETVVEAWQAARAADGVVTLCDVSPPRGPAIDSLDAIATIPADFYCCAYAPGRAVRLDSLAMALLVRQATGRGVIFNLATRDMNLLALQTHLLGAAALDAPNVVIVHGDELTARDRQRLTSVRDVTASGLIASAVELTEGRDFRGTALRSPARLCVGATADLGRGIESEARLAARKVHAGAMFLITQPVYTPEHAEQFLAAYRAETGEELTIPIFWGFAVLTRDSITFGDIPDRWRADLDAGRPGADLATEELQRFIAAGMRSFYVMPPILRGGARDYAAAATALNAARATSGS